MSERIKVLGQAAPSATSEDVLYTVPTDNSAVISSIVVCNRGSGAATYRIGVSVGGGALANMDYLYYGAAIAANTTVTAVLGLSLGEDDEIRVYASTADLTFSVYGVEVY